MPTIGQSITPQAHHINMRKEFITPLIVLEMLNMKQQQQQQQQTTTNNSQSSIEHCHW
jgi:hypothetical protein